MIKITHNDHNIIYYECDCGVKGRCLVKPMDEDGIMVLDIECPICDSVSRVLLKQYVKENEHSDNLSWSIVIENEILSYRPKEDI